MECGICYAYRLNDLIPDKACDDSRCGQPFHSLCLYEVIIEAILLLLVLIMVLMSCNIVLTSMGNFNFDHSTSCCQVFVSKVVAW